MLHKKNNNFECFHFGLKISLSSTTMQSICCPTIATQTILRFGDEQHGSYTSYTGTDDGQKKENNMESL